MTMNTNFPIPYQNCQVRVFLGQGSGNAIATNDTMYYTIPDSHSMVYMMLVGGGGGGGGGTTTAAGVAGNGGGGGGSGACVKAIIPAMFLPKTLRIFPGNGGRGGAAATSGSAGRISYITSGSASVNPGNLILRSGAADAGGGNTNGTAGTAGTIATVATMYSGIGPSIFNTLLAGQAATAGGSAAVGASIVFPTTGLMMTGGAGGGGVSAANATFAGGNIGTGWSDVNFQTASRTISGGAGGATGGSDGYSNRIDLLSDMGTRFPLENTCVFLGGSGGGSSGTSGDGGRGGNGGIGCGGGGGGAGRSAGGEGGHGGPGMIVIISW